MGLDMYVFECEKGQTDKWEGQEVAYWRKANAVHRWFVNNVQGGVDDCKAHRPLTKDDLQTLSGLVKTALTNKDASLLPPQAGFFFGSTDIDEYYWDDLDRTRVQIDSILEGWDDSREYYYISSW